MSSQFDMSSIWRTINVASTRVLPDVVEKFSLQTVYDTIVALNPAVTGFWLTILFSVFQVCISLLTLSIAWNDRLWTIIPPIFAMLYAIHPVISQDGHTGSSLDIRLTIMAILVITWGTRLTWNAIRRGVFSSGFIDHRYHWFRVNYMNNRFLFWPLYLTLCWFFTFMLALATSPLYFAWIRRGLEPRLDALDVIAIVGMTGSMFLEALADNQQYRFQKQKAEWRLQTQSSTTPTFSVDILPARRHDLINGFLQSGLFAYSRHPNFFAEICTWWFFHLFSVSTSGKWLNWTIFGPILYTLLFQFTTALTEVITAQRYPAYSKYQKRVSRLIPNPFMRPEVCESTDGDKSKKDD